MIISMEAAVQAVATACLVWSCVVIVVESIGLRAIFKHYSHKPKPGVSPTLGKDAPTVTIIRPIKGLEPELYNCIASTFRQDYPREKLSIRLCVDDYNDPAYPILKKLVEDFPGFDAQVMVEAEPEATDYMSTVGPNPKIRNISRAYREAKGDIVWIVDCNVWVAKGVLGRMVDKLMGYSTGGKTQRYKFVHQLPLVVDVNDFTQPRKGKALLSSEPNSPQAANFTPIPNESTIEKIKSQGGGRLDELFMATTHAKFYGAINMVGIAPCIVGKSNMFRKSHLDQVTDPLHNPLVLKEPTRPIGVDYFSHNICEDHSIGDLLWRTKIPGFSNHGIVWGDLVVQPMSGMSIVGYIGRRVRWLRARKFTVLAATLVEPGVESGLCGLYFTFAVTTLPWFRDNMGIPQSWTSMAVLWFIFVTAWMLADWASFIRFNSGITIDTDEDTPFFAKGTTGPNSILHRTFWEWLPAWIGREVMAFPIWTWAVMLGDTVNWRGRLFRVHADTTVHEITPVGEGKARVWTPEEEQRRQKSKDRKRKD